MAMFGVTPTEKVDTLTETLGPGFNTSVREAEARPETAFARPGDVIEPVTGLGRAGLRSTDVLNSGFRLVERPIAQGIDKIFGSSLTSQYDEAYAAEQKRVQDNLKALQPDPKTTGWVGQTLGGLTDMAGTMALGTIVTGNPVGGAGLVSAGFGRESYREGVEQGLDQNTALEKAGVEGGVAGVFGLLAPSLAGSLAKRIVSGAAINAALGVGQREAVSTVLNANGYHEMAKQYEALDMAQLGTDLVIGAVFGGAFGPRAKVRLPAVAADAIAPSDIDAALTQNQVTHATVDTAPGIPVNGRSAQAHSDALNTAIEQLAFGEKVNVENLLTDAGFLGNRPDFNAVSIIRDELDRAGFSDVAAKVRELETAAKERGLFVEPSDLNVVLSDEPATVSVGGIKGRDAAVKIGNDYVPAEYRVMESADVRATMDKADNQYRDRTRAASEQQINEAAVNLDPRLLVDSPVMDYGAPVLTADGKIIAGNGRAAFIDRAYATNGAESYRSYLRDNAEALGLSAREIDGMTNPVLVRVLQRDVNVQKAAILSNEGGALGMSALEQAKVDGERLGDLRAFQFGDDGSVSSVANMPFIRQWVGEFPQNQRSRLMDADGNLSAEGQRRLQNAVMYRAYGDSDTLARLVESTDPGSRNIVAALTRMAARVADAKEAIARGDLYPFDLADDLVAAVEKYDDLRRAGVRTNDWVNQIDAFGDGMSGEARALVVLMDRNIRSARAIADSIEGYYARLHELGDPKQGSMFEAATPTKQDVFAPMLDMSEVMYSRAQTETPEFKNWFGDSKVVDADGRPLVVYHGTSKDFGEFGGKYTVPGREGDDGVFYFTTSQRQAGDYAGTGDGSNIRPSFVALKNPLILDAKGSSWAGDWPRMVGAGHDGVVIRNVVDAVGDDQAPSDVIIAFKSTQIKSAIGNRGAFDPNNPNINYSRGGSRSTIADLTSTFRAQFGKDADRLLDASRIKIVQSVSDLPARADATPHPDDVGGMYDPATGTSYLVADNTAPSQIRGRVLHEIGVHSGMETMLGPEMFADVLAQVDQRIAAGDARFIEARRLATENAARPEHIPQETLAYLVENAPEMPLSRRILAAVRQWLYRVTGGRFVDLTTEDLTAMASASLRRQSRSGVAAGGDGVMYTRDQESTPEFKRWFGESKVVDAEGKPLVVYHGTKGDIEAFDKTKTADGGFHFGTAAQANMRVSGEGKNLIPVYLSANNLQRSKDMGGNWKAKIKAAKSAGKEGVVYLNRYEGMTSEVIARLADEGLLDKLDRMSDADFRRAVPEAEDSYIVFEPDQIKSAIGNSGRFDPFSASLTDRAKSVDDFYRSAMSDATISPSDAPLPTTLIPTGETMEPIAVAAERADAGIAEAQQLEPGFLSAVECAMVAGE